MLLNKNCCILYADLIHILNIFGNFQYRSYLPLKFGNFVDNQNESIFNSRLKLAIAKEALADIQKLDEQVKSMMELSLNMVWHGKEQRRATICKVCGKKGLRGTIREHIEANHIEGVHLPCNSCEKTFGSRASLRKHSFKDHA